MVGAAFTIDTLANGRHSGEGRGPVDRQLNPLDSGFRRDDGNRHNINVKVKIYIIYYLKSIINKQYIEQPSSPPGILRTDTGSLATGLTRPIRLKRQHRPGRDALKT
jgi:hypothetical protein